MYEYILMTLMTMSDIQVFFLNYAQFWCANLNDANLLNRLLTGVHSPPDARTNGVMVNIEKFGETFDCPVGSPMRPPPSDKCNVWV